MKTMKFLQKLEKQFPRWSDSWIAAFLSNRIQRVVVNNILTDWKEVEAGFIQGSVLGPILFVLYIADINDELPVNSELQKYANDILGYIISRYQKAYHKPWLMGYIDGAPRTKFASTMINASQ